MASLSALRDGIQALTDLFLDWQQEHENTGRWPMGEIAACLAFGAIVLCSLGVLVVFSVSRHWPKWQYFVSAIAYATAVVLAQEWLEGRIRAARRARRRQAKKAQSLQRAR